MKILLKTTANLYGLVAVGSEINITFDEGSIRNNWQAIFSGSQEAYAGYYAGYNFDETFINELQII